MSGLDEVGRLLRRGLGLVDEEVPDDGDGLAAEPAEQLCDRNAERLALEVEQRHLDACDRVRGDVGPVARVLLHAVQEPFDPQRVPADQELPELSVDDRLDRRQRRSGSLADADEPLVRAQLDDQSRSRLADPAGPLERLLQRDAHGRGFQACYPQVGL